MASLDGSQTGDIKTTKWADRGTEFGYSSPIVDGKVLYQIDNGSMLRAYDTETGKSLWTLALGSAQKASPFSRTARSSLATMAARSSSSGRRQTVARSSVSGASKQHQQLLRF